MADAQLAGIQLLADAEAKAAQLASVYLLLDAEAKTAQLASVYLLVDAFPPPHERITRIGAYIEAMPQALALITRAGAYLEFEPYVPRTLITQTGAYVEFDAPWLVPETTSTGGPFNQGRSRFIFTNRAAAHITRRRRL